jgi:hypothetical protein
MTTLEAQPSRVSREIFNLGCGVTTCRLASTTSRKSHFGGLCSMLPAYWSTLVSMPTAAGLCFGRSARQRKCRTARCPADGSPHVRVRRRLFVKPPKALCGGHWPVLLKPFVFGPSWSCLPRTVMASANPRAHDAAVIISYALGSVSNY